MRHSKQRLTKGATINWSINFFVEDIMDFEFFSEGGTFKGVSLIYSRKGVGPEMEPEKHALTKYSHKGFLFRTTWSCLLLRDDEIRPKTRYEIL